MALSYSDVEDNCGLDQVAKSTGKPRPKRTCQVGLFAQWRVREPGDDTIALRSLAVIRMVQDPTAIGSSLRALLVLSGCNSNACQHRGGATPLVWPGTTNICQ
jgi:hypothetical protein